MPFFKSVFIFNSNRNGWTESWYFEGSIISDVTTKALAVANYRQQLMGKFATIEAIRTVSEDKPKVHVIASTGFVPGAGSDVADTAWNTVLARISTDDRLYQRNVYLRAVIDTVIQRSTFDGSFNPAGAAELNSPWSSFLAAARVNGLRFKARSKTGEGGTERDAVGFGKDANGNITVAVAGATLARGNLVTFSGVSGAGVSDFLRGNQKVREYAAGLLTLETKVPGDVNPATWTNGKVRKNEPTYPLVGTGQILRPTKRSTGRAFFVTRGRR